VLPCPFSKPFSGDGDGDGDRGVSGFLVGLLVRGVVRLYSPPNYHMVRDYELTMENGIELTAPVPACSLFRFFFLKKELFRLITFPFRRTRRTADARLPVNSTRGDVFQAEGPVTAPSSSLFSRALHDRTTATLTAASTGKQR
jgi:hypothetical protein